MSDINLNNIRRLDMTQLLVFSALMKMRKLTLVAGKLGLTQSAISHTLKRLRLNFGDELFLRRPDGVEPTARAFALEGPIEDVLRLMEAALATDTVFEPAKASTIIRLGAADSHLVEIIPRLIGGLSEVAPRMRVTSQTVSRQSAPEALINADIDLAIGFFPDPPDNLEQRLLYQETYQVVVRRGNPVLDRAFDLEAYCGAHHVLVSPIGDLSGIVDRSLKAQGRQRHVVASLPQFLPALVTVARSDLIATLPSRLAKAHATAFDLVLFDPPVAIRPFNVSMIWHKRTHSDLALSWFRDTLAAQVREVREAP